MYELQVVNCSTVWNWYYIAVNPKWKKRSENLCQLSKISDNSQIISCAFLKKTEINISKCYFTRGKCVMSSKRFHWLNSLANHNNLLIFLLAREIGLHFRSYFGIYFLTLKIFWKKCETLSWEREICPKSASLTAKAWELTGLVLPCEQNLSLLLFIQHTYIHTYIHSYRQTDRQTDRQTNIHTCMHVCVHTHAYIHIYIAIGSSIDTSTFLYD